MAKFRLNSASVFTLASNSLSCLVSADVSESIDTLMSECVGQTYKTTVVGLKTATITVSGEIDASDVTALGYFDLGDSGALVFQPAGTTTGMIKITSTKATVVSRDITTSGGSLAAVSITLNLDDLTLAAT